MAAPIQLVRKVGEQKAPHADAIEAAYGVLEELYQHGILSLMHGMVAGGGDIISRLSEGAASPEAVRAMRNLLSLSKILGRVNPEILDRLLQQLPEKPELALPVKPVGVWGIIKAVASPDTRRGLAGAFAFAGAFGKALAVRPQTKS